MIARDRNTRVGFFFFKAEAGIRDLVRSRGLGDVYKRQAVDGTRQTLGGVSSLPTISAPALATYATAETFLAVSYTHLTLPTSDLV